MYIILARIFHVWEELSDKYPLITHQLLGIKFYFFFEKDNRTKSDYEVSDAQMVSDGQKAFHTTLCCLD